MVKTNKTFNKLSDTFVSQFRDITPLKNDRKLDQKRINNYINLYLNNKFYFNLVTWHVAKLNNEIYRLNGQHTLQVFEFLKKGNLLTDIPEITFVEHVCSSWDEVNNLYVSIDSSLTTRSILDHMGIAIANSPDLNLLSRNKANTIASGIQCCVVKDEKVVNISFGALSNKLETLKRPEFLEKNIDFVHFVDTLISKPSSTHKMLNRTPVVAAMYATYLKNRAKSIEFWTKIANNDVCYNTPEAVAYSYLSKTTSQNNAIEMSHRLCNLWNHYLKGTALSQSRIVTSKTSTSKKSGNNTIIAWWDE